MAETRKNLNLALEAELVPWVEFAAALSGLSVMAYINEAVARDCDRADVETAKAYAAFLAARNGRRAVAEDGGE